jgi:hypothetical protein
MSEAQTSSRHWSLKRRPLLRCKHLATSLDFTPIYIYSARQYHCSNELLGQIVHESLNFVQHFVFIR